MSDSDSDSSSDQGNQVRVSLKLANSVQDRSLEVPTEPIAVPADIGRKGLTAVLNHLLEKDDDDAITFEFVVKGTNNRLLRKGVEKEARQHGLSLEEAVSITYFPAANVPQLQDDEDTLPDWVSCLEANAKFVFSACYDGSIHVYEKNDNNDLTKIDSKVGAAGSPIKAMATSQIDEKVFIASAAMDHSLNIHTFEKERLEFYGQCLSAENEMSPSSSAFTSLDFGGTKASNILASGNGGGNISIWNVENTIENQNNASERKRQKGSSSQKNQTNQAIEAMVHFENSHSQSVTGLSWGNHNKVQGCSGTHLISGSWDHSIKLWDVEKENCLLTLNGARVVSCLDTSYHSEGVVATGHPDCTIRLWDLRTNNSKQNTMLISDNTFRPSHKAWVSDVKWSKSNAYQLASTSHDGSVKVWDIRSSNPLHTTRTFAKDQKGLCLLWLTNKAEQHNQVIYAGGTDCIVKRLEI